MIVTIKNYDESKYIPAFQEGGLMTTEAAPMEEAPTEQPVEGAAPQGGDPMQELLMYAQEAVQSQNCEATMQVCQILLQMAQGGAPAEAPAEAPVYKKGGKLSRTIKKPLN